MTRDQFIRRVEGTQKALRRFLVALCCGDSQLADDIAQEACIKAWLSCGSLNDADKFKAWIFRIGYTVFLNYKRSERTFVDCEEARNVISDEMTDSSFKYQGLYAALNKLPDKERTSVLLFYMEGYSIKEIAGIEAVSQEAVRQHLSRGRTHLRGLLSTK